MSKGSKLPIKSILNTLWEEGYFSTSKIFSEITEEIASKGYHFKPSVLGVALICAVRPDGFLSRKKDSGKWSYIQKMPFNPKSGRKTQYFTKYELHPRIREVALSQFENNDFKGAIQNALVEVIDQVKVKSNYPVSSTGRELDGDDLMNHVFGCDNQIPKIKFNGLHSSLDKTEQRGLMNLYKGIVGVRDKKAHLNFIQSDPLKTIEYMSLASLLIRLLDENSP